MDKHKVIKLGTVQKHSFYQVPTVLFYFFRRANFLGQIGLDLEHLPKTPSGIINLLQVAISSAFFLGNISLIYNFTFNQMSLS